MLAGWLLRISVLCRLEKAGRDGDDGDSGWSCHDISAAQHATVGAATAVWAAAVGADGAVIEERERRAGSGRRHRAVWRHPAHHVVRRVATLSSAGRGGSETMWHAGRVVAAHEGHRGALRTTTVRVRKGLSDDTSCKAAARILDAQDANAETTMMT